MQQTYDLHTIIIIITFLSVLILISIYVNKKKDFFKSHLKSNKTISIIDSSIIGHGNKLILFKIYDKQYLTISSKNNNSNILEIEKTNISNFKNVERIKNEIRN